MRTEKLPVPGAVLVYDVRPGDGSAEANPLLIIGSPMGASGFVTLAGNFADRTVITYDPRGAERSERTDGAEQTRPAEHADDLHRLIAALGEPRVDVFASSGGAVNALALVADHPDQVGTLVAHEPPVATVLPDREEALAACAAIRRQYQQSGFGAAMATFILLSIHRGPIPPGFAEAPVDPASFGLPGEDDGTRNDPLLGQNLVACISFEPDFEALGRAPTRIVLAVGQGSDGQLAHRASEAVADRLGLQAVEFPGDHGGFMGGEYGQTGEPDAFAAALRKVLDAEG